MKELGRKEGKKEVARKEGWKEGRKDGRGDAYRNQKQCDEIKSYWMINRR